MRSALTIGLATPRVATSLEDALERVRRLMGDAADAGAAIVCFPEAYLPGLRGQDFDVYPWSEAERDRALRAVSQRAKERSLATIMGMEWPTPAGPQVAAVYIDATGDVRGHQAKVQLDPSEDAHYVPGRGRHLFEVDGVPFGIVICHEGWRYPETVRWAVRRGAKVVFHPQHTGAERQGQRLTTWGATPGPYYEQAMRMRALENTAWFASVNYALRFQESATSVIDPAGACAAYLPYGEEGVLVHTLDLDRATGLLAQRYAPDLNDAV